MKLPLYKTVLKLLLTNDKESISQTFENVLNELCIDDTSNLTIIDKARILLTIRALNIMPTLDVVLTCPSTAKTFNASIDILAVVENLSKINVTPKLLKYDNLEIYLGLPKKINFTDLDFIDSIKFNNEPVALSRETFDNLPAKLSKDIQKFITEIDTLNNQKLIYAKSPYSEKFIDIPASLTHNTIIDFVKIAFKRDLLSIYELEYLICSKLKLDSSLIMNSTYAELNIYINLFKKELEDRQKSGKQLNNPMPGPI